MRYSVTVDVPILLVIFNRPDTVAKVMGVLRKIKPKYLYVAADGPRATRPDERSKTEAAREIAISIDWSCEVKTLFREENMGCRRAVSGAIDWFFEHVEEGIILEDDCVPDPSFFRYANELLARYRNDTRIMAISGDNFHGSVHQSPYSYFLSRYPHCWGWASWRRAWKLYDRDMSLWLALRDSDWLLDIGVGSRQFQRYWTDIFDRSYAGEIDSWAYRWTFTCWAQNGLTILPIRNLVKNIGFGEDATHTKGSKRLESKLELESLDFPLSHIPYMTRDVAADKWTDRHVLGISRWSSLKNLVFKVPCVHGIKVFLRGQ